LPAFLSARASERSFSASRSPALEAETPNKTKAAAIQNERFFELSFEGGSKLSILEFSSFDHVESDRLLGLDETAPSFVAGRVLRLDVLNMAAITFSRLGEPLRSASRELFQQPCAEAAKSRNIVAQQRDAERQHPKPEHRQNAQEPSKDQEKTGGNARPT
jgi:hypothetical protein